MVPRRELITICRQIGTMMEVGVDFLRIIRALREQTDNPRLLELYNQMEHDMRMGGNLADVIDKSPDVFSPFAVSLIRQGEARGDIEGAWHRLADFLKQEAQEDKDLGLEPVEEARYSVQKRATAQNPAQNESSASLERLSRGLERGEKVVSVLLSWSCALLVCLALVWCGVNWGWISPRWMVPLQLGLGAFFAGLAAESLNFQQRSLRASMAWEAKSQPLQSVKSDSEQDNVTVEPTGSHHDDESPF